jgi:hypothetical protein
MALPGGLTTITLTGTFVSAAGTAQSGTVSITPSSEITDAAGTTILTQTAVVVTLNSSGSFSQVLPCTDNAGTAPAGWSYSINIAVGGAQQVVSPVYLPHALGSTVDLSTISPGPVTTAPGGVYYMPNAAPVPSAAPSLGGGFLYANGGHLYWLGVSGTPVLIA